MSGLPLPEPAAPDEALDIQHDPFPGEDHGESRRIPHLGHALLFLSLTCTAFFLCLILAAAFLRSHAQDRDSLDAAVSLAAEAATYVITLAAAYKIFPLIWKRSFLAGIHWNGLAARRYATRLVSAGILLSFLAQFGERFVKEPSSSEIEKFMRTTGGAWSVMLMGTLLAPLMEEIAFRGFLLPALATAYDWLSMERTPAGIRRWTTTSDNSMAGLLFGGIFSSLLFAFVHAPQLHYAWGPVGLLFGVSLVFAVVRVRTHSVACSTVVHLTYNLTIFIAALIVTGGFRHLERLQT